MHNRPQDCTSSEDQDQNKKFHNPEDLTKSFPHLFTASGKQQIDRKKKDALNSRAD